MTARLKAVAEHVPFGSRVADVGSDHAKLALWLETHKGCSCIATDKNPNPLKRAAEAGAVTRLGDGLTCVDCGEIDTAVIAGMGGETIGQILEASPWARGKLCVLQPASRPERLKAYLESNGYNITVDREVIERGRSYRIFVTEGKL